MAKRRNIPAPDKEELIKVYKTKGRKGTEEHYGVSHSVVRRWLTQMEIPLNNPGTNWVKPGDTYHNLQVLHRNGSLPNGNIIWRCLCKCGKQCDVPGIQLKNGRSKGCGCLNKKGFMALTGKKFSQIRTSALRRGYEFDVDPKFLYELFVSQNGRCALSGMDIDINGNASLDRIDNTQGYTKTNVWWVDKDVNMMKRHHGLDYFQQLIQNIFYYSSQTNKARY